MIGCFLWNPKDILLSRSSMQHIYPNFLSLVFQNKIETSFIEDKDSIIQNKVLKISHPNHLLWSCCEWAHKHEICNWQCYYPNACKILDYAKNEITTIPKHCSMSFQIASCNYANNFLFSPCDSWTICTYTNYLG